MQQLPRATRIVFVQRYWYLDSIAEIAQKNAIEDIDDQYLLEAEEQPMKQTKKQISNRWMKYIAVAACAGIVLTSGILIQQERNKSHLTPATTQTEPATTEESVRISNPFIQIGRAHV